MQEKHGISIAGGQDKLKGKIIRIGHMGAIEKTHLLFTIEKLALTFEELGIKVDKEKALTILHDKLKNLEPLPPIDV
jgi:aspartate aminotransferase-like enzyme